MSRTERSLSAILLEHFRALTVYPVLAAGTIGVLLLLLPRWYTVEVSLQPRSSNGAQGGLAGIAAQFGFSLGAGDPGSSPDYYAELALSRRILRDVVTVPLPDRTGSPPRSFIEREGFLEGGQAAAVEKGAEVLQGRMTSGTGLRTGLVYLTVKDHDPATAVALVEAVLARVNEVDLAVKRQRATMERRFIEGRLDTATAELRTAQGALEGFLLRNREYASSPVLAAGYARLSNEVSFRQQVQLGLAQAFEQARIQEVKETPSVVVVAPPVPPVRPDGRGLVTKVILAWMVAFSGLGLWFLVRERLADMMADEAAWPVLAARMKTPWREFLRGRRDV